jgi:hypothetical protein
MMALGDVMDETEVEVVAEAPYPPAQRHIRATYLDPTDPSVDRVLHIPPSLDLARKYRDSIFASESIGLP